MTGLSDEVVLAAFGVGIVALIAWDRWSKARTPQEGGGAQPAAGGAPGTSDGGGGDGPGGGGGDGCGGDGGGTC